MTNTIRNASQNMSTLYIWSNKQFRIHSAERAGLNLEFWHVLLWVDWSYWSYFHWFNANKQISNTEVIQQRRTCLILSSVIKFIESIFPFFPFTNQPPLLSSSSNCTVPVSKKENVFSGRILIWTSQCCNHKHFYLASKHRHINRTSDWRGEDDRMMIRGRGSTRNELQVSAKP